MSTNLDILTHVKVDMLFLLVFKEYLPTSSSDTSDDLRRLAPARLRLDVFSKLSLSFLSTLLLEVTSVLLRVAVVSLLLLPTFLLVVPDSGLGFKLLLFPLRLLLSSGVPSLGVPGFEPLLLFTDVGVDLPDEGADFVFLSKLKFLLVPERVISFGQNDML